MNLFGDEQIIPEAKPSLTVFAELQKNCTLCPLGALIDKKNPGLTYLGSQEARIAFVGDYTSDKDSRGQRRKPFTASQLEELEQWGKLLGVDSEEVFYINIVQCRTKGEKGAERAPDYDREVKPCFTSRALRVLQSLAHLEVVITLGMLAATPFLGKDPEPGVKTHEGQPFGSDLLPGVVIYPMVHPRLFEPRGDKGYPRTEIGRRKEYSRQFAALRAKLPGILAKAAQRRQEQAAG